MGSNNCPGNSPTHREHTSTVSGSHPCQRGSYTVLRQTQHPPRPSPYVPTLCLQRRTSEPCCKTLWLHLGLTLCQPTVLGRNPQCYFHCPIKCLRVLQLFLPFLRHVPL